MRLTIFGAGAVGLTLAAWLAPVSPGLKLLARGESADRIRARGVQIGGQSGPLASTPVEVIERLEDARGSDAVLLAVKTYSLDAVAAQVRAVLGPRVLAIGAQNGLAGPEILARHLPRALSCVVGYNAWRAGPGEVRFQRRGPLVLGARDPALRPEVQQTAALLARAVPASATDRIRDAAACKAVINLSNALTALAGFGAQPVDDAAALQRALSSVLWEGVEILKAEGIREHPFEHIPPWRLLWASAHLPVWMTRPLFQRNLKKMVISSMGQDLARGNPTELEEINGALLAIADRRGVEARRLRALTSLARDRFGAAPFAPMQASEIWAAIR